MEQTKKKLTKEKHNAHASSVSLNPWCMPSQTTYYIHTYYSMQSVTLHCIFPKPGRPKPDRVTRAKYASQFSRSFPFAFHLSLLKNSLFFILKANSLPLVLLYIIYKNHRNNKRLREFSFCNTDALFTIFIQNTSLQSISLLKKRNPDSYQFFLVFF